MRSYYAHLETTAPPKTEAIAPRPTLRSSAIFPALQMPGISTRVLFMGYWILKRHIKEIACIISLRSLEGSLIARRNLAIAEAKTFRVEASELLSLAGHDPEKDFTGSIEVEFFSTQNLFFPFPAVVVNYYGPQFSTVVHTAQRVYNDAEDMAKNSQTQVPESGFNIYVDKDREPFISLINGNLPTVNSSIAIEFFNMDKETLECTLKLGNLAPYETKIIYPARSTDLKGFLKGGVGSGKMRFQVNGIFPRLLVGNIDHKIPALSITHTFYDCTQAKTEADYWHPEQAGWHAASLMVPGEIAQEHFTNVYFYPIYSPSSFAIDMEIYNADGKLLGFKQDAALIQSPETKIHRLPIKAICQELGINPQDCGVRLIARPPQGKRIPTRIKIGLDVGVDNHPANPCNICTNLQPFNPALETKPTSFRWAPFLADQPKATIWLMNSSTAVEYGRTAELDLTFFREKDAATIKRKVILPPHGFCILRVADDKELESFFDGHIGWMTMVTSNPYTTTYYFAENQSGVVGGDHGF